MFVEYCFVGDLVEVVDDDVVDFVFGVCVDDF